MSHTVKECIRGNVKFEYYREGYLHYICDNGFRFTVPIEDTSEATFEAQDKGIFFMRWITRALNTN